MRKITALLFLFPALTIAQPGVCTINVNSQSGYGTYSDTFGRANGNLGLNWEEPAGANAPVQILGGQVYSAKGNIAHAIEVYTAGTFSANQWTSFVLQNGGGKSRQIAVVRGSNAGFYNDSVTVGGRFGNLGNAESYDFCSESGVARYEAGDTHELDVAGSGPVFFWSKRNGVVDATCVDTAPYYTTGYPGLGFNEDAAAPTASAGDWQGGSLPDFSTTPTDNFQRTNAGWLGVNWWFKQMNGSGSSSGSGMILQSDAAVIAIPGNFSVAVWTTPLASNHSSVTKLGGIGTGDYVGPVARYSLPAATETDSDSFYTVWATPAGAITLWEYGSSGTWEELENMGAYSGTVTTMELDASGSGPVALTVRINGTQFGSTYNDSTYELTGTYAGFMINAASTQNTHVTAWSGANL